MDMAATFEEDGIEIVSAVLTAGECDALIQTISAFITPGGRKSAGVRNLLRYCPQVTELVSSEKIAGLARSRLKRDVFPVRVLLFDKTEAANWSVPWHQDLLIAVAERIETPGFGPWSVKAGVIHVQPPLEILESMVTVRVHLDDCDEDNGALRISPGSHAHGILSDAEARRCQEKSAVVCKVGKGGALLMRPLSHHASSPATRPKHRRVIHIEYASGDLPAGLRWFERP
jgi:Phytanoyl-CoA dioxygenase (PhyH)